MLEGLQCKFVWWQNVESFSMKGKVCINNKIDHVVSCINIETIAEPINTIISRQHGVKHEVLEF